MRLFAVTVAISLATVGCSRRPGVAPAGSTSKPARAAEAPAAAAPVAVVELFTSEGCSSCPPADENLARIAGSAHVVALSFHVDYWNGLGWADRFSNAAYSARQERYARRGDGQVYTPQLFVNGASEMLGSDAAGARAAVDRALSRPAAARVELALDDGDAVGGRYSVSGAPGGALLNLALLERTAESRVTRGENTGRTLHHVNVVRDLRTLPLDDRASGRFSFDLPGDLARRAARVAAFAQDPRTLRVLGAAITP